jgi:hypothetical protein
MNTPETTDKELELSGKLHFYKMLESADKSNTDESPIKFNYFNIASKVKPELEARLVREGIEYLEDKLDCLIYPYGHVDSTVLRYHPFDPPEPDKDESLEYYREKEWLSPKRFLSSSVFYASKAWQKIKEDLKLNKEVIKKVHSLLKLDRLKNHIENIIEEIKNSDLRNYADTHETELFQGGVIFKVYRGNEQTDRLRTESTVLEFFQKELPELNTPKVYCHGKLGDFYVLLIEKIEGLTVDDHVKKLKNYKQEIKLLEQILDRVVKIGVEGYTNDISTLYSKLTKENMSGWLDKGIIDKLKTEKSECLLQRIKDNYNLITELLLNSPFLYNKDIPTRNWLIKRNGDLCTIDFENTHFGPIQLDLVTLFEGRNGFRLKNRELTPILKRVCEKINNYIKNNNKSLSEFKEYDFVKAYFAASVHRNLSMAGTNTEKNNQKQTVKHLKKAVYSANKLQKIIRDEKEKKSLKDLSDSICKLQLSLLQ